MRKAMWHYVLDLALALLSLLLALSSLLLWVVFPRGYSAGRAAWVLIHKWGGLAVAVLALAHVLLHWRWLVRMTRRAVSGLVERLRARQSS